ncbi:MAG: NAD(P)-dependent oxidoreductase [Lachnospiraceae bacterium]|nr:NAD(P)-dependent oxidoreductase [Lachnospiraceae bacterium]
MKAIVTGAAGFTGAVLTERLRQNGYEVYAVVRPGSVHNNRLKTDDLGLHVIPLEPERYGELPDHVIQMGLDGGDDSLKEDRGIDVCFHLMWGGGRIMGEQAQNVDYAVAVTEASAVLGVKRIVLTGSQAEYGVVPPDVEEDESLLPDPVTAYGTAKLTAMERTRKRTEELGIEWIWGRIFSLIGKYEPEGRMLPDLYHALREGREMNLSSCAQNWDYLDVYDATDALIALSLRGRPGEIYNIAHGEYRPLKEYTERLREIVAPKGVIHYGKDPEPFISLQPSVHKIREHTGWKPERSFEDSIRDYGIVG